jgi:catechol 2,3-dioxygenase-like lactoylglutathione lyase family enzyme
MILYATLGTSDHARAIRFYDAVLATLSIARAPDWTEGWAGWGGSYEEGPSLWISAPFDGKAPAPGNGTMLAFAGKNEKQVQDFHATALANGGSDEGAPGVRPDYGPNFYVAYVRDPDGNKLACVFHRYESR